MKKLLTFMTVLAALLCICFTVFAADGSTVLTVDVPDTNPSYILHFPATATLAYDNTGAQQIGAVYVTDVKNCSHIYMKITYTDLINKSDSSDTLPFLLAIDQAMSGIFDKTTGVLSVDSVSAGLDIYNSDGIMLQGKVSDWSSATSGATYESTLTYILSAS